MHRNVWKVIIKTNELNDSLVLLLKKRTIYEIQFYMKILIKNSSIIINMLADLNEFKVEIITLVFSTKYGPIMLATYDTCSLFS